MSYQGVKEYHNEAAPLVAEYFKRQRLAKLGYRFDGRDVTAFLAECFLVIGQELDKLETDKMKRASMKKPHPRPR